MNIKTKYNIGDIVYLKTDVEQLERIITAVCIRTNGETYCLCCGTYDSWHHDIEITQELDIVKKTSN